MRAYSMDLRQKIISAYEVAAIARRRLVFADETGFDLAVPRKRGTNVTPVGALALRGWVAALSFSGSLDREASDAFVAALLVPRLRRSDVVLLDNLRVHHASGVEEAVRSAHARVPWLPSYSPDFSPLESCRPKVKAIVRGEEPRSPRRA